MLQLRKLALQLVRLQKTDHLKVGKQNVIKNTKQFELSFTVERCNYCIL